MAQFFRRRKLLRGLASDMATFTGLEGELGYETDTKRVVVHDGTTVGGNSISPPSLTLIATATGVNSMSSNASNWLWDPALQQPNGSGYLVLPPALYYLVFSNPFSPLLSGSIVVAGDQQSAFIANTFKPAVVMNAITGTIVSDSVATSIVSEGYATGSVALFNTHALDSGNTQFTTGTSMAAAYTPLLVMTTAALRLKYVDLSEAAAINVNLAGTRVSVYGPQ